MNDLHFLRVGWRIEKGRICRGKFPQSWVRIICLNLILYGFLFALIRNIHDEDEIGAEMLRTP